MKLIVVLGAGTMGSSIAAQIASAEVDVLLLDMASSGPSRNQIAISGVEKIRKMLTLEKDELFIKVGNFEDDLEKIRGADWVIEVIIEDLKAKSELFNKIAPYVSENAIVSSNTSTIPLAEILKSVPQNIANKLVITHFFNPPRFLPLLEVVSTKKTDLFERLLDFCAHKLGKSIVACNDTPGFIANRIGFFWMYTAVIMSIEHNLRIETVDKLLSTKCMGIPSTGVFGLIDLIGLDVFVFVMNSLVSRLPEGDPLCQAFKTKVPVIDAMIKEGRLGRKTKVGFYRKHETEKGSVLQALNLKSGIYYDVYIDPEIEHLTEHGLFDTSTNYGKFMALLFAETISYVGSLIPSVMDNIYSVDTVMKLGYNWKYGLFELIDSISSSLYGGFFLSKLKSIQFRTPDLVTYNKPFYSEKMFLDSDGSYRLPEKMFQILSDLKSNKPVVTNLSASVWDIGDGIVCFEIKSKASTLDIHVFRLLYDALNIVKQYFSGMIIGSDNKHFSAGANLSYMLSHAKDQLAVMNLLSYGQDVFSMMKRASFPIIGAVSGNALGGGCELLMHCHHIVAHIESYIGFAEAKLGLIPSWGGCKEMVFRCLKYDMPLQTAYERVLKSYTTGSAKYISGFVGGDPEIVMNRDNLISFAKRRALEMLSGFNASDYDIHVEKLLGKNEIILPEKGSMSDHDMKVAVFLKDIFEVEGVPSEASLFEKERAAFISLLQMPEAKQRIQKVIGKK